MTSEARTGAVERALHCLASYLTARDHEHGTLLERHSTGFVHEALSTPTRANLLSALEKFLR